MRYEIQIFNNSDPSVGDYGEEMAVETPFEIDDEAVLEDMVKVFYGLKPEEKLDWYCENFHGVGESDY